MILVTGATGTTGSEVVKALLQLAERPRVLVRDPEKAAELLGDEVEIYRGDFSDPASVAEALEGIDTAFLLTAATPDTVQTQSAFIDAAKDAGVSHVVKLSAVGAAVGAAHRFGDWHGRVEKHLDASGLGWTHLRPSFFLQNLFDLVPQIRTGTIYMPAGDGKAPFVDCRDIGAVAAQILVSPHQHAGQIYDVTGPRAVGYAEIAAALSKALGKPIQYVDVPVEAARQSMVSAGMPDWLADAINELNTAMKENRFATVTDVVQRVGKKTPTSLEQFVGEHTTALGT